MANSLRAKLSKLRHDGNITDAEYQAFMKKLDRHDAEIRNDTIDKFSKQLKERMEDTRWTRIFDTSCILENDKPDKCIGIVDEIAEEMKEK